MKKILFALIAAVTFATSITIASDCETSISCQHNNNNAKKKIKVIHGLKCPNHDYARDNHHFTYEEEYHGFQPTSSTRCIRCGYTMYLHKPQK